MTNKNSKRHRMRWSSIAASTAFFTISILVLFLQQFDFNFSTARGLVIPDVVNITNTLDTLWQTNSLFGVENQFIAITLIYGWAWLIHPSLCFLINVALVLFAIRSFESVTKRSTSTQNWMAIGILLNPYLMLAMPGPNKEIPLLLLTTLYASQIVNQNRWWLFKAAGLCGAIFFIRDGYGIFLLICLFLILATRRKIELFTPAICTLLALGSIGYGLLDSIIPAFSRNSEIYETISSQQAATGLIASAFTLNPYEPIGGAILFGFRLVYNIASLALFPVLSTAESHVYWIGVAYWINGLLILSLIPAIAFDTLRLKARKVPRSLIGGVVVGTWFLISLSLFVQPRYLMPILPLALLASSEISSRVRNIGFALSLVFSLGVMTINATFDRKPNPQTPEQFETPAYVWKIFN